MSERTSARKFRIGKIRTNINTKETFKKSLLKKLPPPLFLKVSAKKIHEVQISLN